MGDTSQSRYSIVERLTETKLELISEKSEIDSYIENHIQKIKEEKKDMENYASSAEQDIERELKKRSIQIEKLEASLEYNKEKKPEKLSRIDAKIVEVDKAMAALQEISKASAIEASK